MITTLQESTFSPSTALIFYTKADNHHETYAELHKIENGLLSSGQPLSQKAFNRLFALTSAQAREISKNKSADFKFDASRTILKFSYHIDSINTLVWKLNPGARQHFFTKSLDIPNGVAPHPVLIFKYDRVEENIYVFSYTDEELTPSTPLFVPAYFNLSVSGLVCQGSAKLRFSTDINKQMAHIEDMFFNSYFSHAGDLFDNVNFNMISFWKSLIGSDKPFPVKGLVKTSMTFKKIL